MTTPMERISGAYTVADYKRKRDQEEMQEAKRAAFEPNPEIERWIECVEAGEIEPTPQMRTQIGYYLREKEGVA